MRKARIGVNESWGWGWVIATGPNESDGTVENPYTDAPSENWAEDGWQLVGT